MKSSDIRNKFLEFFKSKDHEVVASDTLVPKNDPSLLFTSAGMNQFKDQFMGRNITYKRAVSSQKCLRTGDLEKVGKTSGHHTFFEMLGNFSFGDYFKKEAIAWAWEFMTGVLGISESKLWVSVYKDDDEAFDIWLKTVKVPKKRIVKFGAKDNFWPQNAPTEGPDGPCGPCSEIFYDYGEKTGCGKKSCNLSCDCGRFVEVWNLVFTQFNRKGVNNLTPLPSKNIDTGMGLERISAVMQGVKTNFETDLFTPIIDQIMGFGIQIPKASMSTIADHIRAATFAICDGVSPSNEEKGYVVRKLIRRSSLLTKSDVPHLYNLVPCIVKIMSDVYPRLKSRREDISFVIKQEEERFRNTLQSSLPKFKELIEKYRKERKIPGNEIFKLVDTYGLPIEVIESKANKSGYKLDIKGFEECMKRQKELSKDKSNMLAGIFGEDAFKNAPRPKILEVEPLNVEIAFMESGGVEITSQALTDDKVCILTSPQCGAFYAEAGGQVGDSGFIENVMDGSRTEILNTRKVDGRIIHECKVRGQLARGIKVRVILDKERKEKIAINHTATHLLHAALRKVLGEHVHQAGSHVDEKRLRFDFTYSHKLSDREIERIEELVNEKIKEQKIVKKDMKSREDAERKAQLPFSVKNMVKK
ncbi:MAG: alanine--tRNA ligase [Candidatus Omnitrophica bacterium]|nr:alanine--tRNA ligase [Candidatus Omnitrophota bacterium]